MDPISALSVASAVIAFVDFSWKIVTGAAEIYRSVEGTTNENARLEDIVQDLETISKRLSSSPREEENAIENPEEFLG
ncbi:uncharacterized protein F4822DRAFT_424781 [Hypoxylon trugodes]|uniref:uncharacterized protein n=1 Tax=Hypoxylon trugodes TaxID=326681 RepID=UPI00219289A4|nr:uncharacterized protein F4822DRAFT_424781 [Hypoxylon trugodes]KAI1394304.1 hypothetical protein F4822DRAFT_424781 [Hypoxylon trugodes]